MTIRRTISAVLIVAGLASACVGMAMQINVTEWIGMHNSLLLILAGIAAMGCGAVYLMATDDPEAIADSLSRSRRARETGEVDLRDPVVADEAKVTPQTTVNA